MRRSVAIVALFAAWSYVGFAQAGRGTPGGAPAGTRPAAPAQAAPPAPTPPAIETVAPAISGVVAAGAKVVVVRDGFQSTEGPVALPDGTVLFTEPGASIIHKIDANDNISTFLENTNHANGLAIDSKGRLIAVQALTVDILYPKSAAATIGGPFETRPNDLVVDKRDNIYFTLPSATPRGIYYIAANGGKPTFLAEVASPHGIQLSPDEKTLYTADINNEYLVSFDVQSDGKIGNRRDFGRYANVNKVERGFDSEADGVAVDSEGRVYVGTTPGVQVFNSRGQNLGVIPTSQRGQNLAFGGPDKKTLYICGRTGLFKIQMLAQGYKGRPK
jgi:gluconolactonase